jgi:hypothetical protein
MVLLVGCAADAEEPGPITIDRDEMADMKTDGAGENDVCALAAELPADDICSKACDPTAMAAQLLADGSDRGTGGVRARDPSNCFAVETFRADVRHPRHDDERVLTGVFGQSAELRKRQAEIVIGIGIFGLETQQFSEVLRRFIQLSRAGEGHTEVLAGRDLIGFQSKRFTVMIECFLIILVVA